MAILTWLNKTLNQEKTLPHEFKSETLGHYQPLVAGCPKPGGRPRTISLRQVLNAILYVTRGACAWCLLPLDLPAWETVYGYFRDWMRDGTWHRIHETLYDQI